MDRVLTTELRAPTCVTTAMAAGMAGVTESRFGDTAFLRTVRDIVRFTVSRFNEADLFFGHGSANAFDEAVHLALHALHLPPDTLELFYDAQLSETEMEQILSLAARRIDEKIPLAYLINRAWLGEFAFYVDQRVIVPRSFIAELLGEGLEPWLPEPATIRYALDLCTGSGCLSVLMAHTLENARVDAADISADALAVAKHNVDAYNLNDRIDLIQSDLFDALDGRRYDVIVSNPPYVDEPAMRSLPAEYRHEPQLALAGGTDGMDLVRRILRRARSKLHRGGVLIVEVGHNRAAVEAAFPELELTWLPTSAGDDSVFLIEHGNLPQ